MTNAGLLFQGFAQVVVHLVHKKISIAISKFIGQSLIVPWVAISDIFLGECNCYHASAHSSDPNYFCVVVVAAGERHLDF